MKIFKKILVFLLCFVAIIVCYTPSANADSTSIDYGEYNYLVWIGPCSQNAWDYEAYLIASVDGYDLVYSLDYNSDLYYIEYDNIVSHPSDGLYLINASIIPPNYYPAYYYAQFWIDSMVSYSSYIDQNTTYYFNKGYTDGTQSSNASIFEEGQRDAYASLKPGNEYYDSIVSSIESNYQPNKPGYDAIYQAGKIEGRDEGIRYAESTGTTNFYNMLRNIALYPVDFFTEGLDIDIFGVNVGGFLLGFGILALVLFIIRKLSGGR